MAIRLITLELVGEKRQTLNELLQSNCHVSEGLKAEHPPCKRNYIRVSSMNEWREQDGSSVLEYVRSLIVTSGALEWTTPPEINDLTRQLLCYMPHLEYFAWIGVPLETETIGTLRRTCRKIKSINVEYPENMDDIAMGMSTFHQDPEFDHAVLCGNTGYLSPNFLGFLDLEALNVHNMFGDLIYWRKHIVKVLAGAPMLQQLGLSLAVETIARCHDCGQTSQYEDWFDELCKEYAARGASPLPLRSLRCGTAIYPKSPFYIRKFANLDHLREVHIQNKDVSREGKYINLYEADENSGIVFGTFISPVCYNLRRFSAFELRGDIVEAFEALCSSTRGPSITMQLAVSFEEQRHIEMAELIRFPKMHFRMMDLNLERREWNEDLTAENIIKDLASHQAGHKLHGLMVHLPENPSLASGFDHLDLLLKALKKLGSLNQIVIGGRHKFGRDKSKLTETQLNHTADKLAIAVPGLGYIGVYWKFYEVWRKPPDSTSNKLRLTEMKPALIEEVELFRHTIFRPS